MSTVARPSIDAGLKVSEYCIAMRGDLRRGHKNGHSLWRPAPPRSESRDSGGYVRDEQHTILPDFFPQEYRPRIFFGVLFSGFRDKKTGWNFTCTISRLERSRLRRRTLRVSSLKQLPLSA